MKLKLIYSVILLSAIFSSCKKEENVANMPLENTVNNKIIGKWRLVEYSINEEKTKDIIITNDINNDTIISVIKSTMSNIYNDSIIKFDYIWDLDETRHRMLFNNEQNTFVDVVQDITQDIIRKYTSKYIVTINIKEDNTCDIVYEESKIDEYNKEYTVFYGNVSTNTENEYIYLPNNEIKTETSNWYWENSKTENIINAGPLVGIIKSITDSEIIIESIDIDKKIKTENTIELLYTYSDINNPNNNIYGVETRTDSIIINTISVYKWEKY